MKIFSKILVFSLVTMAIVGCNDSSTYIGNEEDIDINAGSRLIHFDADVSTRGALVEGTILQDNFHVLGYQYRGYWESAKVLALPNVFYDGNNNAQIPQTITYSNGVYSYSPIQAWTGNTYTFFGYYPTNHSSIKLFDDGIVKQGDPYITFELPISSDPRDLIDVMTASYVDTGVASSSTVQLQFHHRLSAIDVGARNYYEHDHDNNTATDPKLVTIEIVNLEVNLTNVLNTKAKIYLDHTIPSVYPNQQAKASISYKMVDKDAEWAMDSFDVIPNSAGDRGMRLISTQSGENASSIMLIPQTELLHGALKLTYKKKYQDDNGNWVYLHEGNNTEDFEFNPDLDINFSKPLIEGRRYYIELTFTSDAVSVNIISADEWDEDINGDGENNDDIGFEFE